MTADLDTHAFLGRDRDGESAPSTEPTPEATQQAPPPVQEQREPEPSQQTQRDPDTGVRVPLSELRAERAKRQDLERRIAYFEGQQSAQQRQQHQEPQQPQAPDPWVDPAAAIQHAVQQERQQNEARIQQIERQNLDRHLWNSENSAKRTHGAELVEEAKAAVLEAGLVGHFRNQADPYDALVDWFKRAKAIHTVGPDLDAYEKKVREKVMAELNKGQAAPKFPGTLADATAAGPQGTAPKTEKQMMDGIFGSERKR